MGMFNIFIRLKNLFTGKVSQGVSALENANPEALLELEKQNIRSAEAKYNQGLVKHAALVESLRSQEKRLTEQEKDLSNKITAHMNAGNTTRASKLALEHEKVSSQLVKIKEDFVAAQKEEENLIRSRNISVEAANNRISQLGLDIQEMRRNQSLAELHSAASGMITSIGGTGDNINRIDEIVQRGKNEAVGAARIARSSVNMDEINETEQERNALANAALAKFAAQHNMSVASSETSTPTQKTMGSNVTA